jgi:hypothetical protein
VAARRLARTCGVVVSVALLWASAAACTDGSPASDRGWTARDAESITSVRGMTVRVRHCRGLGAGLKDGAVVRYRRFACVAGARRPSERFDTVGVFYVLHAVGEYDGARSKYRLADVRFVGGPGIP